MKNNLIFNKKISLAITSLFAIATLLAIQSCKPDKLLITDTDLKLPTVFLNTSGWTVVDYTSQEDNDVEGAGNGRVLNAIDGDVDTFWHTCSVGCTPVPPHSFVIDMLEPRHISGFNFVQRQSLSSTIEVLSIDISNDKSSWTSLGEFTLEKIAATQDRPLKEAVKARYFRVNVVKVFDDTDSAALAEVAPYF